MHLACFNAVDRKVVRKCFLDGPKIDVVDTECFQHSHRVCDEKRKEKKENLEDPRSFLEIYDLLNR